ncbi:MAG: CDP-glycerol glycerophosphotransferase family protein, partial [Desulfovibrio sp.]|nr:CDP-glycerol glycerophosphotransferase family protein [Desulfovibrio sp.]
GRHTENAGSLSAAVVWSRLPPAAARALLLSSDGGERLTRLASLLDADPSLDPALAPVVSDIALAAWECDFLSAQSASLARSLHKKRPFLRGEAEAFSAVCAALRPNRTSRADEVNARVNAGDIEAAKELTSAYAAREPGNLFWLRFAAWLGLQRGHLDWYEPWLAKLPMPAAFAQAFLADYAFAREDYARAAKLYAGAFARCALPVWLTREGECRLRLGERDAAGACWRKAFALRPWQSNLLFRLSDIERGDDIPGDPPAGKGEILLYSWNHAADLDACLAALARSRLGDCGVTLLDNGSEDDTPAVARLWRERLGEKMRLVTLPTNIGAPAARNWLLTLESSRAADWVVFLDDDALVPPEWLGLFGTAARRHPGAGVIGCRVVDRDAPMTMQSVDWQMEKTRGDNPFVEMAAHRNAPDFGQYSYLRQAVSVTGCCHLLTRKSLENTGGFDLRFSPSQFDDLERDLRSCGKGRFCLYQGHLRVRHCRRDTNPWLSANVVGNRTKLGVLYPAGPLESIMNRGAELLAEDLLSRLDETGYGRGKSEDDAKERYEQLLLLGRNSKRRPDLVVFLGHNQGALIDNVKYLFLHAATRDYGFESVFLTRHVDELRTLLDMGLPAARMDGGAVKTMTSAGVVVMDDLPSTIMDIFCLGVGAQILQLWHGIPLKKIGLPEIESGVNMPLDKADFLRFAYSCSDVVLSTSPWVTETLFSKVFKAREFVELGYPRNDALLRPLEKFDLLNADVDCYTALRQHKRNGGKVIVYMPTWRDTALNFLDEQGNFVLDGQQLGEFCSRHNALFVLKLHPYIEDAQMGDVPGVVRYGSRQDIYPVLPLADVLVTDYSSIYFDYLLLDRPIVFFAYDLRRYLAKDREMFFPFEEMTPGPVAVTQAGMLEEARRILEDGRDAHGQARRELRERLFTHADAGASERICRYIAEKMVVGR